MFCEDRNNQRENLAQWLNNSANGSGVDLAAQPRTDAKKQGKEKKPDRYLVSLVFPE